MPILVKGLLLVLKSKRGRELLFAAGLGTVELARSERARAVYAKTREVATDPKLHRAVRERALALADVVRQRGRRA